MATSAQFIERHFDGHQFAYFRSNEGSDDSWVIWFGAQCGIRLRLIEDGECLLVSSLPIIHCDDVADSVRESFLHFLLRRNAGLLVGNYSFDEQLTFQHTLLIEASPMCDEQLERIIRVTVRELNQFSSELRRMASGRLAVPDGYQFGSEGTHGVVALPDEDTSTADIEGLLDQLFNGEENQ